MKSLVKKLWIAPLFGMTFFWGVSIAAMPLKASSSGYSLIAASRISPLKNLHNQKNDSYSTIRGRIARFKEHEGLVINDGTDRINVEYKDKYKPLRLRVGELITVKGELSSDNSEIVAHEIVYNGRRVYPQPEKLIADASQTTYDQEDEYNNQSEKNNSKVKTVKEVSENGKTGQFVTIEGEVIEMPQEDVIILRDKTGDILIDIDDAQETLHLKKGDRINVQGNVTHGLDGKKQIEATRIEKNPVK